MAKADAPVIKPDELLAKLRKYEPAEHIVRERDILSERYRIFTGQSLPDLGSPLVKAYVARDEQHPEQEIYALVYDNTMPLRQKNIAALKAFRHPALVALVDEGVAELSMFSEARYVAIVEKPAGQPLSALLATGKNPVPESTLINYLLRPLAEILLAFNEMGISHNRINLSSIYLGKNGILLGECISEPSGFSQPYLFEPIDRALASVWSKADNAIHADCYALAVVAVHLAIGFQPFAAMDKEAFINEILTKGPYHVLALPWEISDELQDFFRGLLNDNHRERWDPKNIESWLSGKRFNIILPSQPREASRGFEFMEQVCFNRKILAHTMSRYWPEARKLLFDNSLERWIETNVHKPEIAQSIARITSGNGGDSSRAERQNNELLSRILMVLDPIGPIRLKHLSVAAEGIGAAFCHAYLSDQQEDKQILLQMIENDFLSFWLEQQKNIPPSYNALILKLQKIRVYIRMTGLGFGIERCLYDLQPTLPCQSPLVKRYRVTTLADLLYALDLSSAKAEQEEYMDRHIAGFIASKLELGKELRIHELESVPKMATHPKLIALKLLMRAQHKAGTPPLKGLNYWIAVKLLPLLENIHKRSLRLSLQDKLDAAASTGTLQALANIILNPEIFAADYAGFENAAAAYAAYNTQIGALKNAAHIKYKAIMAGRGISQTLAYSVCLLTIYFSLKFYYHL